MPPFSDIADLDEDTRIGLIGRMAMTNKKVTAFVTDDDPADKADQYIRKLTERFPGIVVVGKWPGPAAGMTTVKVGPPGTPIENAG